LFSSSTLTGTDFVAVASGTMACRGRTFTASTGTTFNSRMA
jgi:hypothetical protein